MPNRLPYFLAASALLLVLLRGCTARQESPQQVAYPPPVRVGYCLTSPVSLPHVPVTDLLVVDGEGWSSGSRRLLEGLFRDHKNAVLRVQALLDGNGKSYQLARGGTPARLLERILLFPGKGAVSRIQRILLERQQMGIRGVILRDPLYDARAGFSELFLKTWRSQSGFAGFPDDSAAAWWSAARAKQRLLNHFLQQVKQLPEAQGLRLFVELPSPVEAGKAGVLIPNLDSLPSSFGYIGRILSRWNQQELLFQGNRRLRWFAESYTNISWWKHAAPYDSSFWLLVEIPNAVAHTPEDWLQTMKKIAAALLLQDEDRNLIFTLPDFPVDEAVPLYHLLGTVAFVLKAGETVPVGQWRWCGFPWPRTGVFFGSSFLLQAGSPWQLEIPAFFELLLPYLQSGVPVEVVPLNRAVDPSFLNQFEVLVGSYEAYRPVIGAVNRALEEWVRRRGGVLFFYTGQTGPFDELEGWWSADYDRPHESLFDRTGVGLYPEAGFHKVGKGVIYTERSSPAELATMPQSGKIFWNSFLSILQLVAPDSSRFFAPRILHRARGPFHVVFIPEENCSQSKDSTVMKGRWLSLWNEGFPVLRDPQPVPGDPLLLVDLQAIPADTVAVLAATGMVADLLADSLTVSFIFRSFPEIPADLVMRLPSKPLEVQLSANGDASGILQREWDSQENLLRLHFTPQQSSTAIRISMIR